jgi:hypothetical protein
MKKVKRYNEEGYVTADDSNAGMREAYDEGALERANSSDSSQAIADEAKGDTMLKAMRDASTAPKAARPRASAPAASTKPSAPATKPTASAAKEESKPAAPITTAKKETYVDMSGKVQTKKSAADRDAEMAARRESLMSGIKGVGSSIGNMFSRAKQNYESTRPVSRQVQKERDQAAARGNLAKGGTASSRADGIATKGKTRGKMC